MGFLEMKFFKKLVILGIGIAFIIGIILWIFILNKDNSKYFVQMKLSNFEKYLLETSSNGASVDSLIYEYDLSIKKTEKVDVIVELYQNGEKIDDIFQSTIQCVDKNDKCHKNVEGVLSLSLNNIDDTTKVVNFYNSMVDTLYTPYDINTDNLNNEFETSLIYDDIDKSDFINNNEIIIGTIIYKARGYEGSNLVTTEGNNYILELANANNILLVIKVKLS